VLNKYEPKKGQQNSNAPHQGCGKAQGIRGDGAYRKGPPPKKTGGGRKGLRVQGPNSYRRRGHTGFGFAPGSPQGGWCKPKSKKRKAKRQSKNGSLCAQKRCARDALLRLPTIIGIIAPPKTLVFVSRVSPHRLLTPLLDSLTMRTTRFNPLAFEFQQPADRHALMLELAPLLDHIDMYEWTHGLMLFLHRQNGFEKHLPKHEDPVVEIFSMLKAFLDKKKDAPQDEIPPAQVLPYLSDLSCLQYLVRWETTQIQPNVISLVAAQKPHWNPFRQSFSKFIDSRPYPGCEFSMRKVPIEEAIQFTDIELDNFFLTPYTKFKYFSG
jgi:hypothetical protein